MIRRTALHVVAIALVVGTTTAGALAPTAAQTAAAATPIRGQASAELGHVRFGDIPGVGSMLATEDAATEARVDPDGLPGTDGATSRAAARGLGLSAFGQRAPLSSLEQTAPDDNPEPAEHDGQDARLTAHARDLAAVCATTGAGTLASATAGAGTRGSRSAVELDTDETGAGLVRATAFVQAAVVQLAGAVELRIVGRPELVATASGTPGGAAVTFTAPVVEVLDAGTGEQLAVLDAASPQTSLDLPPNSPYPAQSIIELRLGAVRNPVVLDDGTHAAAQAELVQARWKELTGTTDQVNLRLGTLSASATAPAGGLDGCAPVAPTGCAAGADIPHVVVFNGFFGFHHLSIPQATTMLADLANAAGSHTLEVTDNPAFLSAQSLARTDVLVLPSTTGRFTWSDEQWSALEDWLEAGGGVAAVHAASDANYDRELWMELIGGQFEAHPHTGYHEGPGDVTVFVDDHEHPATAPWHGEESFTIADEIYKMAVAEDVDVLLTLDESSVYPFVQLGVPNPLGGAGPYPERQALAWTHTFRDAARVFYTSLGHNEFVFARADFREHVAGGLGWVLEGASCDER